MQMGLVGDSDIIQHGRHFGYFTFSTIIFVFPENLKFYTENTLFDSLACKRCFNTSSCCFATTSGSEYMLMILHFNTFKI